ncbi:MAG TPA: hypothetical protein ENI73_03930 [Spirochaetes bacterium]|nr:hypothetical protein [Spirochaetota bacterium]
MDLINNPNYSKVEGWVGAVYCLSIDMIQSTEAALKRSSQEQNTFNSFLVKQIGPHIRKLALEDAIVQFTGDGWLVMTDKERKIPALICFAWIMAKLFQKEMAELTGFEIDKISPLRLAISSGFDMSVQMPDGSMHWVGDSARRSVRAAACCHVNEVLVDYNVMQGVINDFEIEGIDFEQRRLEKPGLKWEENLNLQTIHKFNPQFRNELHAPEWFVYTLSMMGRIEEAIQLAQQAAETLVERSKQASDPKEVLKKWNLLMASAPDHSILSTLMDKIKKSDLVPNIYTYNILIQKAENHESAMTWLGEMKSKGIHPNTSTYQILVEIAPNYAEAVRYIDEVGEKYLNAASYNILFQKVPNFEEARKLFNRIGKKGIATNFSIYHQMIKITPDYQSARELLNEMELKGIPPNVVTYSMLLKKVSNYEEVSILMDEMEAKGIPSDVVF